MFAAPSPVVVAPAPRVHAPHKVPQKPGTEDLEVYG